MLLGALVENILTLLSFDDQNALIIRNTVDIALYGGQHKIIASRVYDYIDRYKKAPKQHLADILADKLDAENKREAALYEDILTSLHEASQTINAEYAMAQLETMVRRQSLRSIAVDLAKALQRDTEESLDEAETLIAKARAPGLSLFDPGIKLSDKSKALAFLEIQDTSFPIGIPELDKRGFGPTRRELWLFVGNTKAGKSWALIQIAKAALMHKLKVVHVTLEMSEARAAQRYFQALFSISKRKENLRNTKFSLDALGRISGFERREFRPTLTLDHPNIFQKLEKKVDKWSKRLLDNIVIKQFPTGALTVNQLKAYLDNLQETERFTPDLLMIDYPDLMKLDTSNYRLSLDEIFKDLRGIAVDRNIAVAAVSQSHRAAAKAKQVGSENVAEAYSKVAHSDVCITYSQTQGERTLGLARLHVAAGRNDQDKITVVISQQYATGTFVVDSALMRGTYWENIPESGGIEDE